MTEILDIFDCDMNPVAPFTADRATVHREGLWHRTFHCWIFRRDPAGDKVVFQLRGADKDDQPNTLDISAAGHLTTGETPADGLREVKEELGIVIDPAQLKDVGILKQTSSSAGFDNREFCHTTFAITDVTPDRYKPQPDEVDGVFEATIADMKELFAGDVQHVTATGIIKNGTVYVPATRTIKAEDMCGYRNRCLVTRYYLRVMIMGELFLRGERYLAI